MPDDQMIPPPDAADRTYSSSDSAQEGSEKPGMSPCARSRHAVWAGVAALFTDELGRVVLVEPTYRSGWLLPGGAVDRGESPEEACRREAGEELGLVRTPGRLLAVHWSSEGSDRPGEVRYVLDGGVLTAADLARLRLPAEELRAVACLDSRAASGRMRRVDAQVMLAALRARLAGTTAHLTDGCHVGAVPPLDRHQVHTRPRAGHAWPWHPGPVPNGMPIPQAWGWLFAPDGRVVLVLDPADPLVMLPGGTLESQDDSPEAALVREAGEEAQLTLGGVERLGWMYDPAGEVYGGIGECARLRLAAPVTAVGPSALDPATGRRFARLLATPQQAAGLLGWGEQGYHQAETAARVAEQRWGIPRALPGEICELPADGRVLRKA